MNNNYFADTDGWLFATLKLLNKRKLNLNSILLNGDTLNHAIFSLEQLNGGLSRLESEGYIEFIKDKMYLSDKAKTFIKINHKRFESCIDEQIRYSTIFSRINLRFPTTFKEYFSLSEYNEAVEKL